MRTFQLTILVALTATTVFASVVNKGSPERFHSHFVIDNQEDHEDAEFWMRSAQEDLSNRIRNDARIEGEAKNLILFLGDGFGITTLTAARILKGQEVDGPETRWGEEATLHMDTFPFSGLSKTFCSDYQTAESACTATAYLGGTKANAATIGVTPAVKRGDCIAQQNPANQVQSILAWAQASGKSTGIISTSRITDASPVGAYGHIADRDWETDADVVADGHDPEFCDDIAEQLVLKEPGRNINVVLGGGYGAFIPMNRTNEGQRTDGKDLIQMWAQDKQEKGLKATVVNSGSELSQVNASQTDYLFGLFDPNEMAYFHEQKERDQPSLAEMTEKAIQILSKNPKGFFLFVEGGRIDHAHHANLGQRSLWETVEFDKAIKLGDEMTLDEESLLVVTADHSHSLSFAGYSDRGNPIWGYAGKARDKKQTTTLNYANGPGWRNFTNEERHDPAEDQVDDIDYRQVPLVPLDGETHGGEDVGIFAKGPFAHYLSGVHHQNYIPHLMGYAGCIGSGLKYCDNKK